MCLRPFHAIAPNSDNPNKRWRIVSQLDDLPDRTDPITGELLQQIDIPCGKCAECIRSSARDWSTRLEIERRSHDPDQVWFLTLTYDDDHLPLNSDGSATLSKRDCQLFLKRLRKYFPDNRIRYFLCGEYGTKSLRPHYHAVIFGMPALSDLKIHKQVNGNTYYFSEILNVKIWKNGFCDISPAGNGSLAYVAGYVNKKIDKAQNYYSALNVQPEFILTSHRPGIGGLNIEIPDAFAIQLSQGNLAPVPKYLRKKIKEVDPAHYDKILNYALKEQELSEKQSQFKDCYEKRAFKNDQNKARKALRSRASKETI